jgi:site-specific recombinase XerD
LEVLTDDTVNEFVVSLPSDQGFIHTRRAVLPKLLEYLRDVGAVRPREEKADDSPQARLLGAFEQHLKQERGLSQATLDNYLPAIRSFLSERFGTGPLVLRELSSSDVTDSVLRYARRTSPGSARLRAQALRSFLRFALREGEILSDLAAAVPTVANWRLSRVPGVLPPEQIDRLLHSCDQSTLVGQRDYTVLLLLVRLGLRAGELVAMRLEDLHWRAAELTVRGKGRRRDRLPMPQDVGEALATYLRQGRPSCSSRRVFVRLRAPHRGFASEVALCSIVRRAHDRAELRCDGKGAHLLRHSLASEMLRQGASLSEIGQILRHNCPTTTEIYAKVDLSGLRELAQPWPGGEA